MNASNKKQSGMKSVAPLSTRPAPPFKPVIAQLKTSRFPQTVKQPVAPPVYRPQAVPKVMQAKIAKGITKSKPPVAPPAFRPQQIPKVLQTKSALIQNPKAARVSRTTGPVMRPVASNTQRAVQLSSNRFKHLEGPSGKALRMLVGEVTATGTVTYWNGTKSATITSNNNDGFSNRWPRNIYLQWQENQRVALERRAEDKRVAIPDYDAEASVIDGLIGEIRTSGLRTNGGSLSLSAKGTAICVFCKRLIREFCRHYGLTWTNDPG